MTDRFFNTINTLTSPTAIGNITIDTINTMANTLGSNTIDLNYPSYGGGCYTISTTDNTNSGYFTDTVITESIYGTNAPLKVHGDAVIDGELTIGGTKLTERLDQIERRLGILRPNPELEDRWERLKALGEEYRRLEADILAQEEVYNILAK